MPPTILFDAKKVWHTWTSTEIPGTRYGCSDKDWITTASLESSLEDHFLKNAVSAHPLLLLLHGQSIHNQPEAIRLTQEKGDNAVLATTYNT